MRNPIFQYSAVTEQGRDYYHDGTSHAIHHHNSSQTLCGIGQHELSNTLWTSLGEHDGVVSCETCLSELKKHDVVGKYAGPRPFIEKVVIVDGIVLDDFGWGVFDRSYEHFFAYGFHASGTVLGIGRKLSSNSLTSWGELQTTIYAHWIMSLDSYQEDGPYCWLAWRKTNVSDPAFPSLKVVSYEVTVLRHDAWPMLDDQDMETEYSCKRLRDWYSGSKKLGRPATTDDLDPEYAPGYTVRGIPKGHSESTCLEWPTSDFEEALSLLNKWDSNGATEIEISGDSCSVSKEQLDAGAAKIIKYGIRKHGRSVPFHNFLDWYQLKEG